MPEQRPSGTTIGYLNTTDPDANETFTYILVSGAGSTDNASFSVSGGVLQTAAVFDYAVKNSYSLRVRSTDQGGLSFERAFTVLIAPLDSLRPGSLDARFAVPTLSAFEAWGLSPAPDGRVVVVGRALADYSTGYPVPRINPNGSSDTSFITSHITAASGAGLAFPELFATVRQADGKTIVAGIFSISNGPIRTVARLNSDGRSDTTFNAPLTDPVYALQLQADQKLLLGGYRLIRRLETTGQTDSTFTPGTPPNGIVWDLAIQPDRKIVVAGDFTTINGVARPFMGRLQTNGTLDGAFTPALNSNVLAVALQNDGKILVGGEFTAANGSPRLRLARLTTNGSLDSTFAPNMDGSVTALLLQPNGRIVIGGDFTAVNGLPRNRIARLNADGTVDPVFEPSASADAPIYSLALTLDNDILLAGAFQNVNGVARPRMARMLGDAPIAQPTLMNPLREGNRFELTVLGLPWKSYELQFNDTFDGTNWSSLPVVYGNGSPLILTDTNAMNPQRAYRVRVD